MGWIKEVKDAIYDALEELDCNVDYHSGTEERCAYFTVTINEEWDWDMIEGDINVVCEEYNLWIDDDSDGSFDLCEKQN